jgi:hypothetical protein
MSITKVLVPLLVGCLLSCCINTGVYKVVMGSKVAVLPNSISNYKNQTATLNVTTDLTPVSFMQMIKWTLAPACLTFIIWGVIIWFVTRGKDSAKVPINTSESP